ncbi:MAG: DUF5686 family protein [Cytophagales bacterium]|nr:DUF5686 and carboxypeptidase regulatory-like domain-containing protein [Bernardetiaceae bacterium]MDW8205514.1 DUF5686 family protein [Cytophagales bacterium]
MKSLLLAAIALLLLPVAIAQTISGIVKDRESGERIAFANIALVDSSGTLVGGTASDVEGRFRWQSNSAAVAFMRISAVGYQMQVLPIHLSKNVAYEVLLSRFVKELAEVVVYAGENPAHAIIKKAVMNKNKHDPEKIPEYAHKVYSKFIVSVSGTLAAEQAVRQNDLSSPFLSAQSDTTSGEPAIQWLSQKHLFISEAISERKFRAPGKVKETVIANRISGFKNPFFSMLAANLQPFGFYRNFITILDKDYLSPLTPNSTSRYQFILEDSIIINADTIYLISFEPLPGKRFEGLKGVIGISKPDYAIQQIIAETNDSSALVAFRFRQLYEKQSNGKWFPVQLNSLLQFKGQTVGKNGYLIGVGVAYISDVQMGEGTAPVQAFNHISLDIVPQATKRDTLYWQTQRPFPLSALEQNTYVFMDSVLGKTGVETLANGAAALATNALPLGSMFYLIPSRLVQVNRFEGARLGVGIQTSEKCSALMSLGAFAGWGTKDKALKYGGWLRLDLNRNRGLYAALTYRQDVTEAGQVVFGNLWQQSSLSSNTIRNVLAANMDSVREMRIEVGARPVRRNLTTTFSFAWQHVQPIYNYQFMRIQSDGSLTSQKDFRLVEATTTLLFFAGENNLQIMGRTVFSRHTFPVLKMRMAQGTHLLGGEFSYQKVDLSFEHLFRIRGLGRTNIRLDAGLLLGEAPLTKLYFMPGGEVFNSRLIYINNAFQTVGLYEFAADRYAALFLEHHLGPVYRGWRYARPAPSLVHSMLWGAMSNPENHAGISFQVPNQGLFESGLIVHHILRVVYSKTLWLGLGIGIFQRYGLHKAIEPERNRTFRILLKFDF